MSETNVVQLFAEQLNDTEVAANFAYPKGIAQVEQVVHESPVTLEPASAPYEATPSRDDVLKFATAIGTNLEGLRRAA